MSRGRASLRVAQIWDRTVLDERSYRTGGVVVGSAGGADFVTGDRDLPSLFTLFRKRWWRGWQVLLAPGMAGELCVDGEIRRVDDILAAPAPRRSARGGWRAVALSPSDWGVVRLGVEGFFFQIAPRERPIAAARRRRTDLLRPAWLYAITVHALAVGIFFLFNTWPPPGGSTLGGYVIHLSAQTPRPPPPERRPAGSAEGEKKAAPAQTADKAGKSGGEGKRPRATQSTPRPSPRDAIVKKVAETGVLKYGGSLARIAGPSQEDARLALAMARVGDRGRGAGRGTGLGPGVGAGASTRGGDGPGGGGRSAADLVSHGRIDVGTGRGPRGVAGGVKVTETKVAPFRSEGADASGGLTPEQVRAVVERHRSALQWCFEKELQKNPRLSGKVVVYWQIQPAGSVATSKIKSSTVDDADVDDCLVRQVKKWTFPTAENGQVTRVFYPFVFSAR